MIYKEGDTVTVSNTNKRKGITEGKAYTVMSSDMSGVKMLNDSGIKYRIGFEDIVPFQGKGKGKGHNKTIIVFYRTPAPIVATLLDTYRPIAGQHIVVKGIALKIIRVVSNVEGDSVASVSTADSGVAENAALL